MTKKMNPTYNKIIHSIRILASIIFITASIWIAIPGLILLVTSLSKLLSVDLLSYLMPGLGIESFDYLYNNIGIIDIPVLYIFLYTIFKKSIKLNTFDISIINFLVVIFVIPLFLILNYEPFEFDVNLKFSILLIYLILSVFVFSVLINISRRLGYFSVYAKISAFIVFAEIFIMTI